LCTGGPPQSVLEEFFFFPCNGGRDKAFGVGGGGVEH